MPIYNRTTLKNFFKNGANPTEVHFSDLIDSTINKIDDGFAKSIEDGLQLSPLGGSKKVMSFYENVRDKEADWQFVINPIEEVKGLSIGEGVNKHRLFFQKNGRIGVGTLFPKAKLDVKGTSRTQVRVGSYSKINAVPADGNWHAAIENLTDCNAFEIVAKVAAGKGRGKYAMAHAIAVSAFGTSSSKVKVTQSWYGSFWNRLKFRWRGTPDNYRLEMRTSSHYGMNGDKPFYISFHVCSLWDDQLFNKQ
ncbi:adhesin [Fulvivirga maritima]|uniref:adhesin n=1 Tax=Fulvivirga maritima TaxID=2904247 RepID=UPI001F485CF9|nr:adhesin [Fulvivirga maritima]UII27377.1 adhesin [Fulvivirga maritima]